MDTFMFILQMSSERELLKNGMEIRVWVVKKFLSEVDQIVVINQSMNSSEIRVKLIKYSSFT